MAAELPQWQEHWTGKGFTYSIQDPRGRVWRMKLEGSHWALTCEAHPELSRELIRLGGSREFELAERYILQQS